MHDAYFYRKELYLVFEWMDKDLKKFLDGVRGRVSVNTVKVSTCGRLLCPHQLMLEFVFVLAPAVLFDAAAYGAGRVSRPGHHAPRPQAAGACAALAVTATRQLSVPRARARFDDTCVQNVLVDKAGHLKLADFGLARSFSVPLKRYTHEIITLWYRAPEVLLGQKVYSPAVDMWSVGAIFIEMVNKKAIWRGDSEIDQLFRIFRSMGTPTEAVWPGVSRLPDFQPSFPQWTARPLEKLVPDLDAVGRDLLAKMLVFDPARRITARDAMCHPFFDGVKLPSAVTAPWSG